MIIRTCLCIPTYNNHETIQKVVRDCLTQTHFPVMVVDDGSFPALQFAEFKNELNSGRLSLMRHEQNLGKGVAVQTAIRGAVQKGFTHLLTLDGDGQHLVSEIPKFIEAIKNNPWDLILGNRKFAAPNVPQVSKFGRNFSNFWVKFETDVKVSDSQSGFRAYPLFHVQNLKFFTKKFDFEIEVLIRLLWKKVKIHEVEIDVYYPPPAERVSHFDKLWDNVRISILNTIFVVMSLFKSHHSTREISIALGLGVWIGCTPLYGLHTVVAGFLSFIFRLNFIYAWIGTNISIPPLVPLLLLGALAIGKHFHTNWVFGSILFGAALGLSIGVITFLTLTFVKKKKNLSSKSGWSGKMRGGRFGNWFLKMVAQYAGLKTCYFCLNFIFPYFYIFAPQARKASNEYWSVVRPDAGWAKRQLLILKHFHQFGLVLLDRLYSTVHPHFYFKTISHGHANIIKPILDKKGVILLSAHTGGWDLAANTLQLQDHVNEFTTVQYEAKELRTKLLSLKPSGKQGEQPILEIRESLLQGIPIGLMGDRPMGGNFELVLFFGKLAAMDTTPFRIATSCNASLLFTFGFRGKNSNYDFFAYPAKDYQMVNGSKKWLQNYQDVQEFAYRLEEMVKKYPAQWFNFYPFWSALPKPPPGIEAGKSHNHLIEELHTPNQG